MPITSSGEIALIADIEAEFDQTGTEDISLIQAATDAGVSPNMFSFYSASDVSVAAVTTNTASSVTSTSMVLNGNLTNTGGGSVTSHGFYFGTSSSYTSNTKYNLGAKGSTGTFANTRTSLNSSTTYYITAFAVNEAGESVGSTVSRVTSAPPWTVTTAAFSGVSRFYTNRPSSFSNHVHYYKTNYSGNIYANSRYNGTGAAFTGNRYFGSHGPTDTQAVTNSDQMFVFGMEGGNTSGRYVALDMYASGGRSWSNTSASIPFGAGNLGATNFTGNRVICSNSNSSTNAYQYIGLTTRYS